MKEANFNKDGGKIFAEIKSSLQPGFYDYRLWESESNHIVDSGQGNFLNSQDDKFELPFPNEKNDGRFPEFLTTLVITPPIKKYRVDVIITQDGKVIGEDSAEGESEFGTITIDIFLQLKKK